MRTNKIILAIETSCDETAVAILKDQEILANVIYSQINEHIKYKGVVPEIAARLHYQNIDFVLQKAITEANINWSDITEIAYTSHPGLQPALHIGKTAALTLAHYLDIKVVEINHLHAHIHACDLEKPFIYPLVACVFSGGHSNVYYMKKPLDFQLLISSSDDAIGECLDKVARKMGLNYPGGPEIEKLALNGQNNLNFPNINLKNNFFSFSGIKSYAINMLNNKKNVNFHDLACSLQEKVFIYCINMLKKTIINQKVKSIALAGGVSANKRFRQLMEKFVKKENLNYYQAKIEFCTDNAVMVANLAHQKILENEKRK